MYRNKAWHQALSVIANVVPALVWRMRNGVTFWWTLPEGNLCPAQLSSAFSYEDIDSVTVFEIVNVGQKTWICDLQQLRHSLGGIAGLETVEVNDAVFAPVVGRNRALLVSIKSRTKSD